MSFMNWSYNGIVSSIHSDDTVKLPLISKDSTGALIPFHEFVNNFVPEFRDNSTFKLKRILFNGALQNIYLTSCASRFHDMYKVSYGRKLIKFETSDKYPHLTNGQTTADFVVKDDDFDNSEEIFKQNYEKNLPEGWPALHPRTRFLSDEEQKKLDNEWAENDKPIVVVIHGLAGGSHEMQIRAFADKLFNQEGFNIVVLNSRGCCRSKISTPELFSALSTEDIRFFINSLSEKFPEKAIHLISFSFGAAIVGNYLGEEGANSKISSAVLLCCPWDLLDSSYHLDRSYTGSKIFGPAITSYLTNLVRVNLPALEASNENKDIRKKYQIAKNFTKMIQFDSEFTAPMFGFATATDYYRKASPINRILKIQTPTLVLNSTDDPLISGNLPEAECKANPYLILCKTNIGGHLAYVQSDDSLWYIDPITKFLKNMNKLLDHTKRPESHYQPLHSKFDYKLNV
ncbi:hypothetical protein PACTADRAFT_48563 [Pachysolen tannophilus NRRL Y-2460]|uniref:AB hydrolase-1 domain-containing protein n=1 Tax=Pachysolen tannophilus NRRL Y-2460 TaxID=669874 RepID=A0A1E4TYC2_PACTA|nr:hypothetical protein PACTADRAFT_48563 [Pachysolen tannophilus NRRL Y-2460]